MPAKGSAFDRLSQPNNEPNLNGIKAVASSRIHNSTVFISEQRVFAIQLDTSMIQEVIVSTDVKDGAPLGLVSANDGRIFVVYEDFLVRLTWQLDRFVAQRKFHCQLNVQSITTQTQASDGSFYLTDSLGKLQRVLVDDKGCSKRRLPNALHTLLIGRRVNEVKFLSEIRALAVSTDAGLFISGKDSIQTISTDNSLLRSNEVLTVEETSDTELLIGSFRGLMHAEIHPFVSVNRLNTEQKPTVTAIARAREFGTFVASTKGIYRETKHIDGVSFTPFKLPQPHSNISALEITNLGAWVGFQDGKLLFCDLRQNLEICDSSEMQSVSESPITSVTKLDSENSDVVLATLEGRVFHADAFGDRKLVKMLFDTQDPESRLSAVEVSQDHIWFLDLNKGRVLPIDKIGLGSLEGAPRGISTQVDSPWAMVANGDFLFFATPSGRISLFRDGDFADARQHTPIWNSYVDETVFSLEVDLQGRPWIGTSSGLWLRHDNGSFYLEISSSGADAIAADYGASFSDESGHLYFGGTGGLIYINNPSTFPRDRSGSLLITKMLIDGKQVMPEQNFVEGEWGLQLLEAHKEVSVELASSELFPNDASGFEHKLEGFDKEWQNTGSVNVVTYQNLPPGDYVFRARGADSAGIWSDNEISLPISVLPPVWRTWWALAAYLLLAAVLFKYLKAWNDRSVAQRERLRLAEEGSAAFSRLEDDYQAQREANEVLLLQRTSSAQQLLDAIETAVDATLQDVEEHTATAIANRISVLRSLQLFTDRTTTTERTDVHALTNEIIASLAQSNEMAARAIITNDVSEKLVPLEHALYLGLVIQEALELAIMGRRYDASIDPLIYIAMAPPTRDDRGELQYQLRVEDSGLKDDSDAELERHVPITLHLIESGGGEIADDYDAGNSLSISLSFSSNDTALD